MKLAAPETPEEADKLDATLELERYADKLADERVAWQRLERSTPPNLPHIAMTCRELASTGNHGYRSLLRIAARVRHGLADIDIADAYIDAARIQLDHLTRARGLIGAVTRPIDDRNRKTGTTA